MGGQTQSLYKPVILRILAGNQDIPSQDTLEDDFIFSQVGYVIVPWRVLALVIVHKHSEIRTLFNVLKSSVFSCFFLTLFLNIFLFNHFPPPKHKTCLVGFVVQCSMDCQQLFSLILTSNNVGVVKRGRTSVLKHEILRLQRLGKQTSPLGHSREHLFPGKRQQSFEASKGYKFPKV